jgi:hypothetical protein
MMKSNTQCWWCRTKLAPDRRNGGFFFETVTDPEGHAHYVHKCCKPHVRFNTFEPELPDSTKKPSHE